MKRTELESFLKEHGYYFSRDSKHCLYTNGIITVAVPHHREVNKFLAKKIMKTVLENNNYHMRIAA